MRNEEWETVKKLQEINKQDEELRGLDFSKIDKQEEQPEENAIPSKKKKKYKHQEDETRYEPTPKEERFENPPGSIIGGLIRVIGIIVTVIAFSRALAASEEGQDILVELHFTTAVSGLLLVCAGAITTNMADNLTTARKMLSELKKLNKKLDE